MKITTMNNKSSLIKRPELFSTLSQEVKKALYFEANPEQTVVQPIQNGNRYLQIRNSSQLKSLPNESVMNPHLRVPQITVSRANRTNSKPTYFPLIQPDTQAKIEEISMDLQNSINQPSVVTTDGTICSIFMRKSNEDIRN